MWYEDIEFVYFCPHRRLYEDCEECLETIRDAEEEAWFDDTQPIGGFQYGDAEVETDRE
jgi:hypothetical protein